MEFIDIKEKTFNLIPTSIDLIVELRIELLAPINLRLKVFDSAVNVAQGTLLGIILVLLLFEVSLKLWRKRKISKSAEEGTDDVGFLPP